MSWFKPVGGGGRQIRFPIETLRGDDESVYGHKVVEPKLPRKTS